MSDQFKQRQAALEKYESHNGAHPVFEAWSYRNDEGIIVDCFEPVRNDRTDRQMYAKTLLAAEKIAVANTSQWNKNPGTVALKTVRRPAPSGLSDEVNEYSVWVISK